MISAGDNLHAGARHLSWIADEPSNGINAPRHHGEAIWPTPTSCAAKWRTEFGDSRSSNRRRFSRHVCRRARIACAAESGPRKTIRAIVPFTAGSIIDILGHRHGSVASTGQTSYRTQAGSPVRRTPADPTSLPHQRRRPSGAPAAYPLVLRRRTLRCVALARAERTADGAAKGIKTSVRAKARKQHDLRSAGVGSATHWAAERSQSAGIKASTYRSAADRNAHRVIPAASISSSSVFRPACPSFRRQLAPPRLASVEAPPSPRTCRPGEAGHQNSTTS